jgi:hypothetical protein
MVMLIIINIFIVTSLKVVETATESKSEHEVKYSLYLRKMAAQVITRVA